jgi:hypothetical protein
VPSSLGHPCIFPVTPRERSLPDDPPTASRFSDDVPLRRSDKDRGLFGPEAPDLFDFINKDLEPSADDPILNGILDNSRLVDLRSRRFSDEIRRIAFEILQKLRISSPGFCPAAYAVTIS